ncbi:hypothetical protein ACLOJK_013122 [Asimina triloba]
MAGDEGRQRTTEVRVSTVRRRQQGVAVYDQHATENTSRKMQEMAARTSLSLACAEQQSNEQQKMISDDDVTVKRAAEATNAMLRCCPADIIVEITWLATFQDSTVGRRIATELVSMKVEQTRAYVVPGMTEESACRICTVRVD